LYVFSLLVLGLAVYLYSLKCLDAPISSGIRAGLATCRILFLLLLLWLFTRPMIRENRHITVSPTLYIAMDDSQSMSFPIRPSLLRPGVTVPSRWQTARNSLFEEDFISDWQKKGFHLRFSTFSSAALSEHHENPWISRFPNSATPGFSYTDLSAIIRSFQNVRPAGESSYLLLFTDGRWNQGQNPTAAAAELISATNSGVGLIDQRIFTFGIGTTENVFDLSVDSVKLSASARAGESLEMEVRVIARGEGHFPAVAVRVHGGLKNGAETYSQEQTLSLSQNVREQSLRFEIPALPPGDYLFTVEVPPLAGELLASNNTVMRGIRIRETKDRVLLLTTAPDWEFKYLKRALEDQTSIAPEAFLIRDQEAYHLGDRDWVQQKISPAKVTPSEPSPSGTTTLEAILKQPDRWSVIVLYNFLWKPEYTEPAKRLREYLENGGGILFVPGALNSTPAASLQNILPPPLTQAYMPILQQVVVDPAGLKGSVFESVFRDATSDSLPPLYPYFRAGAPMPGAGFLLQGTTGSGEKIGLMSQDRFGLGRLVIMAGNSFWRWNLLTEKNWLTPFWQTVLYQCNPKMQTNPGELATDTILYETYSPVQVSYTAKEAIRGATLNGVSVAVSGPFRKDPLWLEPDENHPGRFIARYTPVEPGEYQLAAEAFGATATFRVETSLNETTDLRQNLSDLRAVAQMTGGEYANQPAWKRLAQSLPASSRVVEEQRSRFVGEKWWMALSLIFLLGMEWYLRWRKGLP